MKLSLTVKDRQERDALERALTHPDTRAFVLVIGTLLALPSDRARSRVLNFVADYLAEQSEPSAPTSDELEMVLASTS